MHALSNLAWYVTCMSLPRRCKRDAAARARRAAAPAWWRRARRATCRARPRTRSAPPRGPRITPTATRKLEPRSRPLDTCCLWVHSLWPGKEQVTGARCRPVAATAAAWPLVRYLLWCDSSQVSGLRGSLVACARHSDLKRKLTLKKKKSKQISCQQSGLILVIVHPF